MLWFDEAVKRLNSEGRGRLVGAFGPDDRLLVVVASGAYELVKPELSTHFPDDMIFLDKWHSDRPLTVVHRDGEKKAVYVKRFHAENSSKTMEFIGESEGSSMLLFTDHGAPVIKCTAKDLGEQRFSLNEFISVKGVKARGKRLSVDPRAKVTMEDTPDPNAELPAVGAFACSSCRRGSCGLRLQWVSDACEGVSETICHCCKPSRNSYFGETLSYFQHQAF